jgi:hypothetical protein
MSILPELERDLGRAADQRLRAPAAGSRSRSRRRARVAASALPVVLGVLAAVVIAVIAIGAFRHGHGSAHPAGPKHAMSPRAELIHAIAALREPQISADQDPGLHRFLQIGPPAAYVRTHPQARKELSHLGYPRPDRGLLRVVTVPSLQAHVLIDPTTYQPSPASPRRTEGINLVAQGPGSFGITGTGPRPRTVGSFLMHGLSIFGGGSKTNPGVLLVPDGVARVTLGPARPLPFQTPYRVKAKAIAKATATVYATTSVHDNIAAFDLKVPTIVSPAAFSGVPAIAATAATTWYAANGTVIRRTTSQIYVSVKIIGRPRPLPQICKRTPRADICKRRAP